MTEHPFGKRRSNLSAFGQACGTCKFACPLRSSDPKGTGECRRKAPMKGPVRFPQVNLQFGWCGQYERDPTAQDGWAAVMTHDEWQAEVIRLRETDDQARRSG